MIYDYFKQLFAQVTNPPIDSIREEARDLVSRPALSGRRVNLLDDEHRSTCHQVVNCTFPIISTTMSSTNIQDVIDQHGDLPGLLKTIDRSPSLYEVDRAATAALEVRLEAGSVRKHHKLIRDRLYRFVVILSDREHQTPREWR